LSTQETIYKKDNIKIGKLKTNEFARIEVEITKHVCPRLRKKTVDHKKVTEYLALSIVGDVYTSNGTILGCGQILDEINPNNIKKFAKGMNAAKLADIIRIWDEWHLNDLNAACIHQESFILPPTLNTYKDWKECAAKETAKCPKGYAYGSAWLLRPLPQDVVDIVKSW